MVSKSSKLLKDLENVTTWKRRDIRAPHKPLLLLAMLAAVQRGEERLWGYDKIDVLLSRLLIDFGPPRKATHPEYPFWRLQNDGNFWEVPERSTCLELAPGKVDIPKSVLRKTNAHGGFTTEVYEQLRADPELVNRITATLLQSHFASSCHEDILDAIGMPWVITPQKRRDPAFRETILRMYEYRCAVCGFDGRLGTSNLALEAAHVRWHAANGPDTEDNGLALCVFHHKMLDRGAMGLDEDRRVMVSQYVNGNSGVDDLLLKHAGQPLRGPQKGAPQVAQAHIAWHTREVFRGPARATTPL